MKLSSLFPPTKTLASTPTPKKGTSPNLETVYAPKPRNIPGSTIFSIDWPKAPAQGVKDYKVITDKAALRDYLERCQATGYCSFDWETAPSEDERKRWAAYVEDWEIRKAAAEGDSDVLKQLEAEYKEQLDYFKAAPLDPHRAEVCTASISATPHEARVLFLSHKKGRRNFLPALGRDEARSEFFDMLDEYVLMDQKVVKTAFNLPFETKLLARYKRYVLAPVSDPFVMAVRCMQVVAPHKIKDPKRPYTGKSLKALTKEYLGVQMNNFRALLEKHNVQFFDEISTDDPDAVTYSAEDSDYGLQQDLYWAEVAKQILNDENCPYPTYYDWLREIESPFGRCIGLMEYWGMAWDETEAERKREEALRMQEDCRQAIVALAKDYFNLDVDPGKSGKTGDTKHLLFDVMKVPAASWGKTGPSLAKGAILNMIFMLENKLVALEEEKYLAVDLPEGWETIDAEKDPSLMQEERGAIRIAQRDPHPYQQQGIDLLKLLQKMQNYSTLLSSHIVGREKYQHPVTKRIHAQYTPWTETARTNSSKPNGQNVPAVYNDVFKIRNLYKAAPGKILFFIDFAGFELRLMGWKSKDSTMIEAFLNGGDLHRKTAATMTGKAEEDVEKHERTNAKAGNFGISYGGTEHALQSTFLESMEIRKTLDECKLIVDAVKQTYPGISTYQREIVLDAREKGYVETIYGYKRLLPNINGTSNKERSADERRAANTPIQGSAADIMKRCQNRTYDAIALGTAVRKKGYVAPLEHGKTDMIANIHDEIIFEMDDDPAVVQAAAQWVQAEMEKPPIDGFPVPIVAEASVGYRWGEKTEIEDWLKRKEGISRRFGDNVSCAGFVREKGVRRHETSRVDRS